MKEQLKAEERRRMLVAEHEEWQRSSDRIDTVLKLVLVATFMLAAKEVIDIIKYFL